MEGEQPLPSPTHPHPAWLLEPCSNDLWEAHGKPRPVAWANRLTDIKPPTRSVAWGSSSALNCGEYNSVVLRISSTRSKASVTGVGLFSWAALIILITYTMGTKDRSFITWKTIREQSRVELVKVCNYTTMFLLVTVSLSPILSSEVTLYTWKSTLISCREAIHGDCQGLAHPVKTNLSDGCLNHHRVYPGQRGMSSLIGNCGEKGEKSGCVQSWASYPPFPTKGTGANTRRPSFPSFPFCIASSVLGAGMHAWPHGLNFWCRRSERSEMERFSKSRPNHFFLVCTTTRL